MHVRMKGAASLVESAFKQLRENINCPSVGLELFEPLFLALYEQYDASLVRAINAGGIALQEELEEKRIQVPAVVEDFLEMLAELSPYPTTSQYSRSISDLLQYVRDVAAAG